MMVQYTWLKKNASIVEQVEKWSAQMPNQYTQFRVVIDGQMTDSPGVLRVI